MFGVLIYTAWLLAVASSHPLSAPKAACPPFSKGTINIASYQLYPENVDFDEQTCLLCLKPEDNIGSLYNASVVVYDPYKAAVVKTIEFPNITRTVPFHIGGVAVRASEHTHALNASETNTLSQWDPYLGSKRGTNKTADEITILVDAAAAHETAGRDVSGDNYIIRYDARAGRVLWTTNLTRGRTRVRYNGYPAPGAS
ncbi:hypothetical protein NUW58_g3315 [Xylaria curta]|uniref:Uncharacterized protein n=1 Tax=Xylaria curta TaxID=42375 RepID=A0ACC1PBJ4_9PEZI|nr:hypothetical protein NUW58_g3315 [Xylaria curta]